MCHNFTQIVRNFSRLGSEKLQRAKGKMEKNMVLKRNGLLLILLGVSALLLAGGLFFYNKLEERSAAQASNQVLLQMQAIEESVTTENLQQTRNGPMSEIEIDGEMYIGQLSIPALNLELPIISQWSYQRLKKAPCRYSGTVAGRDLVLMAHNYSSHFGRINDLPLDTEICFRDVHGTENWYRVTAVDIVNPEDVEEITSDGYDLTLFTCTYGGRNRVVARCEKIDRTVQK